jgi:hypothetical protein
MAALHGRRILTRSSSTLAQLCSRNPKGMPPGTTGPTRSRQPAVYKTAGNLHGVLARAVLAAQVRCVVQLVLSCSAL